MEKSTLFNDAYVTSWQTRWTWRSS